MVSSLINRRQANVSCIFRTPTPRPLIETTVNAANNVVITPTINEAGISAKLIRFRK